jgi:hypothetical protein
MPSLAEFLGQVLVEIAKARVQADLESARIAELYASHPLLEHMPVPRFRLPKVGLDVPLAFDRFDAVPGPPPVPPDRGLIRQNIGVIIDEELKLRELQLSTAARRRLDNVLNELIENIPPAGVSGFEAINLSGNALSAVLESLKTTKDAPALDPPLDTALRRRFDAEFLKLQLPSPPVPVVVATAQLREIGPPQTLTRVQLTISEEGVEWAQTNPSDPASRTLLPE